jgi:methionyl-tRNA formyltransferase
VVFAYHNVGVRCLKVLLGRGLDVPLVVTHANDPNETVWFESVAATARDCGIPVITPEEPNGAAVLDAVRRVRPDFLFSFYYRRMLGERLLAAAPRGAYNMHGSLLPKYRGRVPVNWAVLNGETETGATLHLMERTPDSGPIVDQFAVPILPDDTAGEVFAKVTVAAEIVLWRALPALIDGSARPVAQDLSCGSYFGGRRPEDGRIDGRAGTDRLHDFVRALSRPYPGAFTDLGGGQLNVWKTRIASAPGTLSRRPLARLALREGALHIDAADGGSLRVLDAEFAGLPLDAARFTSLFGSAAGPDLPAPNDTPSAYQRD